MGGCVAWWVRGIIMDNFLFGGLLSHLWYFRVLVISLSGIFSLGPKYSVSCSARFSVCVLGCLVSSNGVGDRNQTSLVTGEGSWEIKQTITVRKGGIHDREH